MAMSGSQGTASSLPEDAWNALAEAYEAYKEAKDDPREREDRGTVVANLAKAAEDQGWPRRVVAEPCGVTPERLRQVIRSYENRDLVVAGEDLFPQYRRPTAAPPVERQTRKRSHLTPEEVAELKRLAPLARANTGSRPLESEYRKASEEFSRLIMEFHDRGVVWREMADVTGLTINGVRIRASRHGYGKGAPPSIKPYMRVTIHDIMREKAVPSPDEVKATKRKAKSA